MSRQIILFVLVLALLLPTSLGLAQGDNPVALVDMAISYLSRQLGRPIARADIQDWSWQEMYWPDASMDCPYPGEQYAQEMTRGYVIRLDHLDTRYELRASPTGDVIRLCDSEILEPTAIPETQQQQSAPPAATADDREGLTDTLIAYLGVQLYGTPLTRANMDGWTWQEVMWNDTSLGCPREGQTYETQLLRGYVFNLTYAGRTYDLHITADGSIIMPCHIDEFVPAFGFSIESALATASQNAAVQQSAASQPTTDQQPATAGEQTAASTGAVVNAPAASLVYTGADGNFYLSAVDSLPGQSITTDVTATPSEYSLFPTLNHAYGYYRWSPDGISLVFTDNFEFRLMSSDFQGTAPVVLAEDLAVLFPPAWHYTSTEVAYLASTGTYSEDTPAQYLALYAIEPPVGSSDGSEPRLIGTIEYGTGCGGGSSDPADYLYAQETGYTGNTLNLFWLPDETFLFSPNCTGIGLARFDPATGETTTVDPELARASLSPDNRHVAGVAIDADGNRQLVRVNLSDNTRQVIPVDFVPDRVLWSRDGQRLYVASAELVETLGSPDATLVQVYNIQLWEVPLSEDNPRLLFAREGRGVGQIAEAPDRGGLVFSFIDSARAVFQVIENEGDIAAQTEVAPAIHLFFINPDGQVFHLGEGGHPALQPVAISPDAVG